MRGCAPSVVSGRGQWRLQHTCHGRKSASPKPSSRDLSVQACRSGSRHYCHVEHRSRDLRKRACEPALCKRAWLQQAALSPISLQLLRLMFGHASVVSLGLFQELVECISWGSADLRYVFLRLGCRTSRADTSSTIHAWGFLRGKAAATRMQCQPLLSASLTPHGRPARTGHLPTGAISLIIHLCKMRPGGMTAP